MNNTIVDSLIKFPWKASTVRGDVKKIFNLRMPESYLMKLRYIAHNTTKSANGFLVDIVTAEALNYYKNL